MNPRRLTIHSVAAVLALACAYAVAGRSSAKRDEVERPLVFDVRSSELRELQFARSSGTLTLEPRMDEQKARYAWVTVAPEGKRPVSFRGGRYASHVLEGYLPLRAIRTLGKLSQVQRQEGGLDGSTDTVTIAASTGERKLVLGSATVAGEGRRALASDTGQVFILANDLLPSPERAVLEMFDPSLHAFSSDEITRVTIASVGRAREAVVQGKLDPPSFWSWQEDLEHPSQELSSWAQHVERMTGRAPVVVDNPGEPALTVTYFHADREHGFLKLWPCLHEDRRIRCVGMTEHTVGFVEVSPVAEQIVNDAQRMLGAVARGEHAARTSK
jgi:hypothetical protein